MLPVTHHGGLSGGVSKLRVDLFDYELPEDRIALRPVSPRDSAKMLVVRPGAPLEDRVVRDLPNLLEAGDALVFNDTKVIPAQLDGVRSRAGSTATVGVTLHLRAEPDRWKAFVKGAKKLKPGDRVVFGADREGSEEKVLKAEVLAKGDDGEVDFRFDRSGTDLDEALASFGHVPLPPYIAAKRPEDDRDLADYQTIYAREDGAVAAPTAGLHFTPDLLQRLQEAGIGLHYLTLHVGAGTFLPVKAEDTDDHRMHVERGTVSAETAAALNAVRERGGRIVSVGTTSLRLLESAADETGHIRPFHGETDIFITPGYQFRAVDILMTNFHLPKSTLMMLVSAFSGLDTMRSAYAHAIENGYRFYSYGDSSLLYRQT